MACEPMERILTTLKTRIPGVTDDLLALELYNVIDRFFRRTNVWRFRTETSLEEDITRYDLFPPADSNLVRVMWALHGDNPINPAIGGASTVKSVVSRGLIDADAYGTGGSDGDPIYDPDRLSRPGPNNTFRYAIYFPHYMEVTIPADTTSMKWPVVVEMSLTLGPHCLSNDCGEWSLEDWMYDRYANDWIDGVQASLMAMIAKPWSNPAMAKLHGANFFKAMSQAKVEGEKGLLYNTQRWRYPRGGFVR